MGRTAALFKLPMVKSAAKEARPLRGFLGKAQSKAKQCYNCVLRMVSRIAGIDEVSAGQLYSDLILCKANQTLGSTHPPSLKFLLSS